MKLGKQISDLRRIAQKTNFRYHTIMIVMKFGGSSVANAERIRRVAEIIRAYENERPVVVLSAMGDTTDFLLEAADCALGGKIEISEIENLHRKTTQELGIDFACVENLLAELKQLLTGIFMIRELTKRTRDYLVSFGERMSVRIMAAYLKTLGIGAAFFDAWDIGIMSDSNFTKAELLDEVWQAIPQALKSYSEGSCGEIPSVTGFIATDKKGEITTLGRGGSDLSATIIGAALGVKEIQTWKDVDGIMTTDPRICAAARTVPEVTYEEAQELAMFGAQVLHPRSMKPCLKSGVPVRVKNSYNIKSEGSIIVKEHSREREKVCAITSVKHVTLIDIVSAGMLGAAGFLAHIFNQFLKWEVSVDLIATSEVSVSLTVNTKSDLSGLVEDLSRVAQVGLRSGKSIVSIICDSSKASGIPSRGLSALSKAGINAQMISQGASKVNVSIVVDDEQCDTAVRTLHAEFFEK